MNLQGAQYVGVFIASMPYFIVLHRCRIFLQIGRKTLHTLYGALAYLWCSGTEAAVSPGCART